MEGTPDEHGRERDDVPVHVFTRVFLLTSEERERERKGVTDMKPVKKHQTVRGHTASAASILPHRYPPSLKRPAHRSLSFETLL